jgi:hypothetical protein
MRAAAVICFVLALVAMGVWVAHGQHLATLTEKLVEREVKDEFGEEIVEEWVDTFEVGLDITGPVAGGLVALGFGLLLVNRRRSRRGAPTDTSSG